MARRKAEPPVRKEAAQAAEGGESLDPMRVIAVIPIRPYHVVADLRSGTGSFTIPFAKYLFDGKVYAVDGDEASLEGLRKRLAELRITNVEYLRADGVDIPINAEALDGAILPFILHDMEAPTSFLQAVHGLLKRGGWAAVLEGYKRQGAQAPPTAGRMSEEELAGMAREAGFRFSEKRDIDGKHYLMILRK